VKQERMSRLLALGEELSLAFRREHAGTMRPVLWESERPAGDGAGSLWHGHTDNYIPVYGTGTGLLNRVTPVELGEVYDDGVRGYSPLESI